jgi:hypothetical protein
MVVRRASTTALAQKARRRMNRARKTMIDAKDRNRNAVNWRRWSRVLPIRSPLMISRTEGPMVSSVASRKKRALPGWRLYS